jgi:hypothetical protein
MSAAFALNSRRFRCLLDHGADPNGDDKNLCTPMSVMAQRGYYEGVKVSHADQVIV